MDDRFKLISYYEISNVMLEDFYKEKYGETILIYNNNEGLYTEQDGEYRYKIDGSYNGSSLTKYVLSRLCKDGHIPTGNYSVWIDWN